MNCESAVALVKELHSAQYLPPFSESILREVVDEINTTSEYIVNRLSRIRENNSKDYEDNDIGDADACNIIVHHNSLTRNKRCALTYLFFRMLKIRNIWWELGYVIPDNLKQNMSPSEKEFFTNYDSCMSEYSKNFPELDLTGDLDPPKDLYIEVFAPETCEITTEHRDVRIEKNTTSFMKRADVAAHIRRGALEQIVNKE